MESCAHLRHLINIDCGPWNESQCSHFHFSGGFFCIQLLLLFQKPESIVVIEGMLYCSNLIMKTNANYFRMNKRDIVGLFKINHQRHGGVFKIRVNWIGCRRLGGVF